MSVELPIIIGFLVKFCYNHADNIIEVILMDTSPILNVASNGLEASQRRVNLATKIFDNTPISSDVYQKAAEQNKPAGPAEPSVFDRVVGAVKRFIGI